MLAVLAGAALATPHATASDPPVDELNERCATRLAIAFTGESAIAAELASATPKDVIAGYLTDARFTERFARFLNAQFNPKPGVIFGSEDAAYFLGKWILENNRPYKELFVGDHTVEHQDPHEGVITTELSFQSDYTVGYFTSYWWKVRYAGNEPDGYALQMAHRILNNTLGVHLVANTNAPGADLTTKGREAPACRGCHYEGSYPLDKIARLLPRRAPRVPDQYPSFDTSIPREPQLIWGKMLHDERDLVATLVDSDEFKFNACRLAFKFLYGRPESPCESELFDRCFDAFAKSGMMQDALSTIANDASFCEGGR